MLADKGEPAGDRQREYSAERTAPVLALSHVALALSHVALVLSPANVAAWHLGIALLRSNGRHYLRRRLGRNRRQWGSSGGGGRGEG